MSSTVIETRGLVRRFGGLTAVQPLDLTVAAGEAVAVFGPNGAGKSTLLRLLATLLRPSLGSLALFGRSVRDDALAARRRIGLLSHQSFLYPDLTPLENLDFFGRMFGVPQPLQRAQALIEDVGLVGWAHRPVRTLSRGLEQRCALARTLLHQPQLILLDEPFTGLDVDAATMLSDLLRQAHRRGATLLMVTHDLDRGLALCERGIVLARGRLLHDGPIDPGDAQGFESIYLGLLHAQSGTPPIGEGPSN